MAGEDKKVVGYGLRVFQLPPGVCSEDYVQQECGKHTEISLEDCRKLIAGDCFEKEQLQGCPQRFKRMSCMRDNSGEYPISLFSDAADIIRVNGETKNNYCHSEFSGFSFRMGISSEDLGSSMSIWSYDATIPYTPSDPRNAQVYRLCNMRDVYVGDMDKDGYEDVVVVMGSKATATEMKHYTLRPDNLHETSIFVFLGIPDDPSTTTETPFPNLNSYKPSPMYQLNASDDACMPTQTSYEDQVCTEIPKKSEDDNGGCQCVKRDNTFQDFIWAVKYLYRVATN
ncbi:MAG: hypothetical protein HY540_08090 [Deltaproteobacteria bacterium]|nr:hypothetical protein [Deltaproteobacteria bacterium]